MIHTDGRPTIANAPRRPQPRPSERTRRVAEHVRDSLAFPGNAVSGLVIENGRALFTAKRGDVIVRVTIEDA